MENIDLSKFEEEERPIDIKYYITKYSRYWPLYLTCIAIGLVAVFLFHRYTVEQYQVKGSIMIKRSLSPEVRILDRSQIFSGNNNLENDILLFTSKNLAEEALKKLHFDVSYYAATHIKEIEMYENSPIRIEVDWEFPQNLHGIVHLTILSEDTYILSREETSLMDYLSAKASVGEDDILGRELRFGETVQTSKLKFKALLVNPNRVGDMVGFKIHHPSSLVDSYARSVTVRPQNNYGSVLEVSMVSTVVEKGRDYVNALMDSFLEYDLKEKNRISENTLAFIDDQLFLVEDSLKSVERRMQNFKVSNKLLDVNKEFGGLLTRIESLEETIQGFEFELAYYRSLEQYLSDKGNDYSEVVAPSLVGVSDLLLNGLVQNLVQLSLERRKLLSVVKPNHPDVAQLDQQIDRLRENVFENIQNLVQNTESRKKEIYEKLRSYDHQFANLPEAESNYTHIFREFKLRENLYTYLLEKRAEAGIAKASNVPDNAILDYAKKGSLIYPKKPQNYGMAVGLGFMIPLAFLLLYHYLNNKIVDQIQLKSFLKIPLLSTVGFSNKDTNMIVAEHPRSLVSESFRSLRSALFYIASEKKCKTILVTSSVSGEGKTFVALNLASAMALSGKKTCLIGMDLRKPKVSQYMGVSNKKGLSSLLVGTATGDEVVQATKYDNLYIVPSGPVPPNPAELLLKDKLKGFLDGLKEQFDVIVLDTPPVGLVSETMDLLRFSDVNLYIVRQNYTHKKHLLMINDLYSSNHVSDFYAVFNGFKGGGDIYDYEGYTYGYGYNYSYMKKNKYTGNYYEEEGELQSSFIQKWISKLNK
ncbi:GumC family protein [Litoribacter populi]|uniref:GumC family protein n=1 Tax=Litoribacter populi TaxID=2598460 RepID=UPI0011811E63|nr:polysaccharide biosynthesis tyrosine autokinase [Litoribacter populi]